VGRRHRVYSILISELDYSKLAWQTLIDDRFTFRAERYPTPSILGAICQPGTLFLV